ncbi:hypothetical protein ACEQ8H_007128 [Pleosporales sp. CAS-2024a]
MPPRPPARLPWPALQARDTPTPTPTPTPAPARRCLRAFASTPAARALGPQSPSYIDVPKPRQPTFALDPEVKGHLPVPRDIFKTRSKHPKASAVFLARATKPPQAPKAPGPHRQDAAYQLYKQRLAETRRIALNQGVEQLHQRRVASDAAFQAKLDASYAERIQRAMAPPRDTDVLTANSVQKGIRDFLADQLPTTSRRDLPQRRLAYQRRMARLEAVRAARLHDLYVNARQFLVDESQLDAAIDQAFGTDDQPIGWDQKGNAGLRSAGKDGLSPWHGPLQEGVAEMMQKLRGGEGVGLAKERVRKVAEALTGGKM